MKSKSLYECMMDPRFFGSTFAVPSFAAWRAVAKMLDGLPLEPHELTLYKLLTGRDDAPTARISEAYLVKPRRAGGTLFAAALGLHAALPHGYEEKLGPGEVATVALIASDRRQAGQLKRYIAGLIEASPMIAGELVKDTAESIEFKHRVRIEVHTPSYRSTRGYSYAAVILDELAFFRAEDSATPDVELVRAVRPGLMNLRGRLIGLSSPHARRGHLYEMHRQYYGVAGADVLVIQAQEPGLLNPNIDVKAVERAMAEDPEAARSEWYGQFRSDVSQFLPDELIDAAVVDDARTEMPWKKGVGYLAFVDVSGGMHDASVLGIAHQDERTQHVVLDQLIRIPAPHRPSDVVDRFSAVLQRFYIHRVVGDRYGAAWVQEKFEQAGLKYEPSDLDKSAIYIEASHLFAERRVELLNEKHLLTELRALERRPRAGGRADSVDHPPRAHDDSANAACGALWLASSRKARPAVHRRGDRPEFALMY